MAMRARDSINRSQQVQDSRLKALYGSGSNASVNGNLNKGKLNYAQVEEQSGLHAGKDGVDVTVQGNTLKQSLVIGSDVAEATKFANKASKNLDNVVEGNARLTGSQIHRETGILLGEKLGKAESLSELANSYFKGTNGYTGKQPDLSWRGRGACADLTTAKQWQAHMRTYKNSHGLGIPILYSPVKV